MKDKAKITVYFVSIVFLVSILFLIPACESNEGKRIFDRTDSGRTLELSKGQEFDVVLRANPSTGYSWEITDIPNFIKSRGKEFKPDSKKLGSPGKTTLHFEVEGSGKGILKLDYGKQWEKENQSKREWSVRLVVK